MHDLWSHPARLVPLAFLVVIAIGTAGLMLPAARAGGGSAPFVVALFTATSAVSVTGLAVVDTATYWSGFGQTLILVLFQIGGFGIMSTATLLALLVSRRLSLSRQLVVQAETRGIALGDVTSILRFVLLATLLVEAATALVLAVRLHKEGMGPADALWHGTFHAVAAFTNAGFSTFTDSMTFFARDWVVLAAILAAVVIGGLGLPVLHDLRRGMLAPRSWSLHTKLTLAGSAFLLPVGCAATLFYEWGNPGTLGPLEPFHKVVNALFHSAMARSGGLNAFDLGNLTQGNMLVTYALMAIGGGSAGTAGGIKVSTFLILGLAVWSELRGQPDVTAFGRRISSTVQREALTIALIAILVICLSVLVIRALSDLPLRHLVFEVISAFGNVGLSMGITGNLPPSAQVLLSVLMFVGRVGTITVATALALRGRKAAYRYPEERPIVG